MSEITSEKEMEDIFICVVLPLLLDLIDKWEWFPDSTPLKHIHKSQFQDLRDMITIDHVEVKQRLKAADIKIVKKDKFGPSLDYTIYVRRKVENVSYWKGIVKAEMSRSLGKYVARLDKSKFNKALLEVEEKKSQNVDQKLFVNFE
ncbi:hypothetical protein PAECIP111891_06703 [Paenibacillus allorhizoplanae]|uniref:Uncharacterized protein n=1 Tax=Paenibacillus allorhizoplanae TaxID=2905648 RepID=A0ABM9CYJ4_9BACL|nr:hypothetical protein [Paenibacillus allorhizoplanae]CAH1230629.1 hypothetical protein PAECIP111891_06703 [Paenibacillus allorhizoplanae]